MKKLIVLLVFVFSIFETYSQNGYEKAIELGGSLGVGTYSNNTFSAAIINGYRLSDSFFTGIGVGIGYSNAIDAIAISRLGIPTEYRTEALLIPIYANFKVNLSKEKISPFVSANIGYTIDANQYLKDAPGFMFQPSVGVDFKTNGKNTVYLLMGLNLQHYEYTYTRNVGTNTADWDIENRSEIFKAIDLKLGVKF